MATVYENTDLAEKVQIYPLGDTAVSEIATLAELPNPGAEGQQFLVRETGTIYWWDVGTVSWQGISGGTGGTLGKIYLSAVAADDSVTPNVEYHGAAEASTADEALAVWMIYKSVSVGGDVTFQYADGNTNTDNIWDDRESLTYLDLP